MKEFVGKGVFMKKKTFLLLAKVVLFLGRKKVMA